MIEVGGVQNRPEPVEPANRGQMSQNCEQVVVHEVGDADSLAYWGLVVAPIAEVPAVRRDYLVVPSMREPSAPVVRASFNDVRYQMYLVKMLLCLNETLLRLREIRRIKEAVVREVKRAVLTIWNSRTENVAEVKAEYSFHVREPFVRLSWFIFEEERILASSPCQLLAWNTNLYPPRLYNIRGYCQVCEYGKESVYFCRQDLIYRTISLSCSEFCSTYRYNK